MGEYVQKLVGKVTMKMTILTSTYSYSSDFNSMEACFHHLIKKTIVTFFILFLQLFFFFFCYRNKITNCDFNWVFILRTVRGKKLQFPLFLFILFFFFSFAVETRFHSIQIQECDHLKKTFS